MSKIGILLNELELYWLYLLGVTMIWVGITGPMGGGKSSVARILRSRGYTVIDADQVVHELMAPGTIVSDSIFKTFGPSIKSSDGSIDRKALGRAVFGSPEKLSLLEQILHPQVRARVAELKVKCQAQQLPAAFYDVPLLFEKNMVSQFDYVLVVSALPELRMQRLKQRTGLTEPEIQARWQNQLPAEYKESHADALIWNNGSWHDLESSVDQALARLGISPTVTKT